MPYWCLPIWLLLVRNSPGTEEWPQPYRQHHDGTVQVTGGRGWITDVKSQK